jgi:predicted lysophospholipase L1 biosynthesis ABC-type transport system permease subunit
VTKAFADQFFPGVSPIGRAITSPGMPPGTRTEIAGIVADVRENGPTHAAEPLIYWCGYSPYWPDPYFIVRFQPARPVSLGAIRAALVEIEPKRAVYGSRTLTDTLSTSVSQQRLSTLLLALFAATTLLLAALGLYGVLSQFVAARRRDLGVRMALGARPSRIVASVVGRAAGVTGIGIAAGLAAAFAAARFMAALVFEITTHDPVTFALVPLMLAAVAAAASLAAATRAASIDPMQALRE